LLTGLKQLLELAAVLLPGGSSHVTNNHLFACCAAGAGSQFQQLLELAAVLVPDGCYHLLTFLYFVVILLLPPCAAGVGG
jgi:hypothetical protein